MGDYMNLNQDISADNYNIFVFNRIVKLAPFVGACAAVTFTIAKLVGLFSDTSLIALLSFDFAFLLYVLIAMLLKRKGIENNGVLNRKTLVYSQIALFTLTILQWNLISYIFPSRDFWGYAPLFVLLNAFYFSREAVAADIIGLSISIAISWLINGEKLLPERDAHFQENLILRIVSLIFSFLLIYFMTSIGHLFKENTRRKEKSLIAKNKELSKTNDDIIAFTADIIEQRDLTSGKHVKNVKEYTSVFAKQVMHDWPEYDLTEDKVSMISLASMLHDIGKVAIPDSILLKTDKLTEKEYEIIKTHTILGASIISELPESLGTEFKNYSHDICLYHHERYDGNGYPYGLSGEEIPVSAQIVAIADCFEAITSKRPYNNPVEVNQAKEMLRNGACGVFSPKLIESFLIAADTIVDNNIMEEDK